MGRNDSFTIFWGCFWAASTRRRITFPDCIYHSVRLVISAYKYTIFFTTSRLSLADDICILSPKDSVEIPTRLRELLRLSLLAGGFTWIITWGIACFWRESFSLKKQQGRLRHVQGTDWCHMGTRTNEPANIRPHRQTGQAAPLSLTPITPGGLH